jgi:ribonuclease HII
MAALAERFDGYGWERNMGYGTAGHRAAIKSLGPNAEHRRTWKLVPA